MRLSARALALAVALAPSFTSVVAYPEAPTANVIPGQYIVQLKEDADNATWAAHHQTVRTIRARQEGRQEVVDDHASMHKQFDIGGFKGYSGSFDASMVAELKALPEVEDVHPDVLMYPQTMVRRKYQSEISELFFFSLHKLTNLNLEKNAQWGLCSISIFRKRVVTTYLYDDSAGEGTYTYILDSGIRTSHVEFEGRARWGTNVVDRTQEDVLGHGTFLAGVVGSKTYGVAKKTNLISVKVIDHNGLSPWSIQLRGLNWAVNDILHNRRTAIAVILLAISGPANKGVDLMIKKIESLGILVVTSAGNGHGHADRTSPCRSPAGICVGAHDEEDFRLPASNFGPEVDIWAPGHDVWSTSNKGDDQIEMQEGTSISAAFVAGLACYFRSMLGPMEAVDTKRRVLNSASSWLLKNIWTSRNQRAYNGCGR